MDAIMQQASKRRPQTRRACPTAIERLEDRCVLSAVHPAAATATTRAQRVEIQYLEFTADHHTGGVALATLAEQRATNTDLKALATNAVMTQTNEIDEIKSDLALWYSIQFTPKELPRTRADVSRLSKLPSGESFDVTFSTTFVMHHDQIITRSLQDLPVLPHGQAQMLAENIVIEQGMEVNGLGQVISSYEPIPTSANRGVEVSYLKFTADHHLAGTTMASIASTLATNTTLKSMAATSAADQVQETQTIVSTLKSAYGITFTPAVIPGVPAMVADILQQSGTAFDVEFSRQFSMHHVEIIDRSAAVLTRLGNTTARQLAEHIITEQGMQVHDLGQIIQAEMPLNA